MKRKSWGIGVSTAVLAALIGGLGTAPASAIPVFHIRPGGWVPSASASAAIVPSVSDASAALRTGQSGLLQPAQAPSGTTAAAPGLGALPYFGFEKIPLSNATVARVNLGNGNLLLTSNDAVLNGPGVSLRNDRFYNGLSTEQGAFGGGWSSTLSPVDVRLTSTSTTATFYDTSGHAARFTKSGSTWTASAGFNATLEQQAQWDFTLTFNKTG
jgi:hypothetical protein